MDPDEQQPMFESVEAMCAAYGWPPEMAARIRRDMEVSAITHAHEVKAQERHPLRATLWGFRVREVN